MKNAGIFFNAFVRDTELCIMGMLDIEGRFVRSNRGLERLLGAPESELAGVPITRHFFLRPDPETKPFDLASWLGSGKHHNLECAGTSKTGSPFSARVCLSALADAEGAPIGYGIIAENLTPGMRMETAMKQSEDRFRKAFSAAPDGLVISRVEDSAVLEINESWQAIFGYTREETVGKSSTLLNLMEPGTREKILARLVRDGRIRDLEIQVRTKAGIPRDVIFSTEKLKLDGVECMMTILRDITEKKRNEQELRNRQKLYRTLAAHFPASIVVLYDAELRILVAEGERLSVFGLSPEKIEGRNVKDIAPAGTFAGVERFYRSALEGKPTFHESGFLDRHWAVDHVPVADEDGAVWGGLMVCRDVTELKNTIRSLEKSEHDNRTLLEAIPDFIFRFGGGGKCVDFKPGQSSQADPWPTTGAVGKDVRDLFPKESAAILLAHQAKALHSGQSQICEFSTSLAKETREWEARTVPLGGGEILLLVRDITGSRNLERLAANIAAWEQRRLGGELHDGICQEMAGISFLCKVLESKLAVQSPDLGKSMADISSLLGDAIRHTRALISGLYPAGLEHGLPEALRDLVGRLGKVYPCAFSFLGEDQNLGQDVAAHIYLIAQEAAGNAARHGRAGNVRIHFGAQDGNILLKVSDDGLGIPKDRGNAEGRGMDIMRYRARLIGARIDILSREGKGTTVSCSLPADLAYGFKPREK